MLLTDVADTIDEFSIYLPTVLAVMALRALCLVIITLVGHH